MVLRFAGLSSHKDSGLIFDLIQLYEQIIPVDQYYKNTWGKLASTRFVRIEGVHEFQQGRTEKPRNAMAVFCKETVAGP